MSEMLGDLDFPEPEKLIKYIANGSRSSETLPTTRVFARKVDPSSAVPATNLLRRSRFAHHVVATLARPSDDEKLDKEVERITLEGAAVGCGPLTRLP